MKKLLLSLAAIAALSLVTGCATPFPIGSVYTGITLPHTATGSVGNAKKGAAECVAVLTLVAVGDCSVEAAARDGEITRISHVDYKTKNILGVYGEYTTIVYGE